MNITKVPKCNECDTVLIETPGDYNRNMIYQYCPKCDAGCGMYEVESTCH